MVLGPAEVKVLLDVYMCACFSVCIFRARNSDKYHSPEVNWRLSLEACKRKLLAINKALLELHLQV